MPSSSAIRLQIESALAHKIPSALTPAPKTIRPVAATGIVPLDEILNGGLPIGAVTELTGPECSGRTSIALSFLARVTHAAKVCAWIDVSDTLDPLSASAAGIDLARLLWVRCGMTPKLTRPAAHDFALPRKYLVAPATKRGLHGGGFGPHPRTETNGLSQAFHGLFTPNATQPHLQDKPSPQEQNSPHPSPPASSPSRRRPWSRMEQALHATDLLLQGGGFSAIVLDMGSLSPDTVLRVPLATWYRYRAAAERTQSSVLLLTQHPCAKSSAELALRLHQPNAIRNEATVFSGIEPRAEVVRSRFTEIPSNVIPLRKPPQAVKTASWQSRTAWAGRR